MDPNHCVRFHWVILLVGLAAAPAAAQTTEDTCGVAQRHYTQRSWPEAEQAFRQLLQSHPDHEQTAWAKFFLAEAVLQQSRFAEARRLFLEFLRENPQHQFAPQAQFRAAEAAHFAGQKQDARQELQKFREQNPDHSLMAYVLSYLADLAYADRQWSQVDAVAQEFADRFPGSPLRPQVQQLAARAHLEREQFAKALDLCQQLVQPASSPAAPPGPTSSATRTNWYYLGLAYLGLQRFEDALEALTQVQPTPTERTLAQQVQRAQTQAYLGAGQVAAAIAALQRELATHPPGPEATTYRLQLAQVLARGGRWQEGWQIYQQVQRPDSTQPDYLEATAALAEAAYAAGRYETAQQLFAVLAKVEYPPELQAQGLSGLGWCHYHLHQWAPAREAFARLVEQQPASLLASESALMQARMWEQLNRPEQAVDGYLAAAAQYEDSEHAPVALLDAARLQEQLTQSSDAIAVLQRLIERYPNFDLRDGAQYQLAWLLTEAKRGDEANQVFRQLAEGYPTSRYGHEAAFAVAEHAARAAEHQRATTLLQDLLTRKPEPALLGRIWYLQGQVAAVTKDWAAVEELMQRLLDKFPNTPLRLGAEYWIAESLYRRESYTPAAERFDRLARQIAGRQETWLAVIPLRQAQLLLQQQQWSAAAALAADIERRFPNYPQQSEVDYALGRCLIATGKFEEARVRFASILESPQQTRSETGALAQWMIGESYFQQRQWDDALAAYRRVGELFPSDPRWQAAVWLQTGKCFEQKGERQEAIRSFNKVVDFHAPRSLAEEASRRLRSLEINREAQRPTDPSASRR